MEVWTPMTAQQQLMNKFADVETRLDKIEYHIGLKDKDKEEELKKSREEVAAMKQSLQAAVERLAKREKELMDTREELHSLTNQTAIDRHKIEELEKEKVELHRLVHNLEIKLENREQKIRTLENDLHIMKEDLGRTQDKLDTTQEQLEIHKAQMRKTSKTVKKMESQMEEIMKRMELMPAPSAAFADTPRETMSEPKPSTQLTGSPMALPPLSRKTAPRYSKETKEKEVKMNFPPRF